MTTDSFDVAIARGPTRHGDMYWLPNDIYIGRSLADYGEYGWEEVELLGKLLKPGDRVIESGANIGTHTLPLSRFVGKEGYVYALEPQPLIFQILCTNLQVNLCANVRVFNAGTSNVEGVASIPDIDYEAQENFGGVQMIRAGLGKTEVPLVKLDDVIPKEGGKITLIKADVEGMELMTLLGSGLTIGDNRPALYVENNLGPQSAELIRFMHQINYRCWWHSPALFNPKNLKGNPVDLWPNTLSINMLCLPAGDPRISVPVGAGLAPVIGPRDRSPLTGHRPSVLEDPLEMIVPPGAITRGLPDRSPSTGFLGPLKGGPK